MDPTMTGFVTIALIGFAAFHVWIRHQRRLMVSRERIAAIEKGIELPSFEQDVQRSASNVQRILLLAGLCWISLGIGALIVMEAILSSLPTTEEAIARHMEWVVGIPDGFRVIGVVPLFIGVAHLIVYAVGRKKER